MIDADELTLSYATPHHRVNVLRGARLRVGAGERVAVLGPSGSGKSSLLLVLAGLERPDAGRVSIDGVDLASLDRDGLADLRRERIGIVFQAFHLLPSLTALENVALPLEMAGASDATARAQALLAQVGLAERAQHLPAQLSGGEQQRVAIARALVHRPRLVLADEPTGNLDGDTAGAVRDLLFALNEQMGTTLLLVTHDATLAARCDRILRLADGRLVADRSGAAVPA